MAGIGGNSRLCLLPGFYRLASILTLVEEDGVWPDAILDAYIAMIQMADGDSTPWVAIMCAPFFC